MERTNSAKVSPVSPISMVEPLLRILYTTPPWVCPPPALGQPADAFRIERPYQYSKPHFIGLERSPRISLPLRTRSPVTVASGRNRPHLHFEQGVGTCFLQKKCSRQRQRVGGRTEECSSKVPTSSIARGGAVPSLSCWLGILQYHPHSPHQEYPCPPCVNMINNDRL
ncbi:hypothetical protein LX32DRAFT_345796 [Colletotrichum zoysiae]|uniref:Uncharacterized protein n=1 Tax=Colletotrichum zoysiae TaxID=1216348 RepID=A0AAD9HKB7_9PEZI|nr:hypothetical protein LX32DRAFT_345796 [Colletotrichum zoysiae]